MDKKLLAATLAGALGGAAITRAVTPGKPPHAAPKLTDNSCGCWDTARDEMVGFLQAHEKSCPPGQEVFCGAALKAKVQ